MNDFENRAGTALVLGGTGGVGRAVVELLTARKSSVVFTYRSSLESAEALAAATGSTFRQVDLLDAAATARLVDDVVTSAGALHSLVYAAGPKVPQIHLSRVAPELFAEHLNGEVTAFFNAVHPALPHLRAAEGSIVAVTTAATDRYAVRDGLSAGTKAAIESLVTGFAAEEGRFGVRANSVGPGMLSDGMASTLMAEGHYDQHALDVATANIAMKRFGVCADVAEAVCFLASDRAGYISGQHLNVDGGYTV